jgi:predicted nucleic acid-binding protein
MTVVADTSALVSLGCSNDPIIIDTLCSEYELCIPEVVVAELEDVAAYDDEHAQAARRVLQRSDGIETERVSLDSEFPLDDGENAAVSLANDYDAGILLCDEFDKLGLIHASLDDVKLVTTPKFLLVLEEKDLLSSSEVAALLDEISDVRSWGGNSYVERVRDRL